MDKKKEKREENNSQSDMTAQESGFGGYMPEIILPAINWRAQGGPPETGFVSKERHKDCFLGRNESKMRQRVLGQGPLFVGNMSQF